MSNYYELEVWQKSRALTSEVYRITRDFPRVEMFGLTQQMRRAAVSVPSNIAEAHGRRSDADIVRFLLIARGSLLELETEAIIAGDLDYIAPAATQSLLARIGEAVRLLNGLIRHYARRQTPADRRPRTADR
ncbi:MAG: four helix bundle protein [Thermoanaerobaculia bacterium]